ncbi:MAG: hypothetical protein ACI3ZY_02230 [Parabacteroides sp.]
MIERLKRIEKEKIRLHFVNEPFYRLCREIHREFLDHRCTIPISPEELFIDAIQLLDELISFPEKAYSRCENLWTDTFGEYRIIDAYSKNKDIIAEVAMIYTSLLETLRKIPNPLYHKGLMDLLYSCLCTRYVKGNEEHMRQICLPNYRKFVGELIDWILVYVESEESLSEKIETLLSKDKHKHKQSIPADSCFLYHNKQTFQRCLQDFIQILIQYQFIPEDTDYLQVEPIFRGKGTNNKIRWIGKPHNLTWIMKKLFNAKVLTTNLKGRHQWDVVALRFVNEQGEKMANIAGANRRKDTEEIANRVVQTLIFR